MVRFSGVAAGRYEQFHPASMVKYTAMVTTAFKMALWRRDHGGPRVGADLIHHSDAGDGHVVLLGMQNEPEWVRFCEKVIQRPNFALDERFISNTARVAHRDALNAVIASYFSALDAPELESRLKTSKSRLLG